MNTFSQLLLKTLAFSVVAYFPDMLFAAVSAEEAITTPFLETAPNFRDLAGISADYGGTGFVNTTDHGGLMRTGVFYRTNALNNLSDDDWNTLSALHIYRDIDLRTPNEIYGTSGPPIIAPAEDRVPEGTIWTNINIYGTDGPVPSPYWGTPDEAVTFMKEGYQAFVTDSVQLESFRTVLLTLAHDTGPDLWHCSGGKDRTGWTAALMQSIAGVSETTIMQDYLATNSYMATLITSTKNQLLGTYPFLNPLTIDALLGVDAGYLQAGLDEVIAQFGTMSAYLTQGLGLTQEDIYVLRAKMVFYPELPGQGALTGNAAAGAALLNALQDSPLSGSYTAYNFYLQSAIDQGSLDGVETRVGGQVHADATSFLLRHSQRLNDAISPYTDAHEDQEGQSRIWMAGHATYFSSDHRNGISGSNEQSGGSIIGATRRISPQVSVDMGLGYQWGSVESGTATATVNSVLGTVGGRYGLTDLASGLFLEGRADLGWVDYESKRFLGGGLGTAQGKTEGTVYGVQAYLGDVFRLPALTATPKLGVGLTGTSLSDFTETGSDLALDVHGVSETFVSLLADLDIDLNPQQVAGWSIVPRFTLGYERILGDPAVETIASLYDNTISQKSAFADSNLYKIGLGFAAERGALELKGAIRGMMGDDADSSGIDGLLSLSCHF